MRKFLLAAVAAAAIASPAMARDNSICVGLEGGAWFPNHSDIDVRPTGGWLDYGDLRYKDTGYDIDVIAGYDFGLFRAEVEASHKRVKAGALATAARFGGGNVDADGKTTSNS